MTFRPGESGNPNGKPKGALGKRTLILKEITDLASKSALPIAQQLVERALEGDIKAAELFFRTFLPKKVNLEDKVLLNNQDITLQGQIRSLTEGIASFNEVTQEEAIERLKTFSTIKSNEVIEDHAHSIRESREQLMENVARIERIIEYKERKE